jgi:hypothetical protein
LKENVHLFLKQDSKKIKGIQLADLFAHTVSMMLKDQMGLLRKTIKAGEHSGYDPEMQIELGFAMWASIRYLFFQSQKGIEKERALSGYTNVADYGLLVSSEFSDEMKKHIYGRFSSNYLGCIH